VKGVGRGRCKREVLVLFRSVAQRQQQQRKKKGSTRTTRKEGTSGRSSTRRVTLKQKKNKPGPIDIHYSIKVELTGCVRIDSSKGIKDLKKAIIALETDRAARLTPEDLKLFYEGKEISEKTDEQPQPSQLAVSQATTSSYVSTLPSGSESLMTILDASSKTDTTYDVTGQLNLPVPRPEAFLDTWQVSRDRIVFHPEQKPLGAGSFGTVYKGQMDGADVAIKVIKLSNLLHKEEVLQNFKNECQILSQLRHTNVLLLMGICVEENQLLLVTEFMRGGSVHDLLHHPAPRQPPLSLHRRLVMARDCCLGMNHMHRKSILHLDLKPQNLLVDSNGTAKVADFGQSKIHRPADVLKNAVYGTAVYMAPEILQEKEVTTKADVYSFGIMLWELIAQKEPYAKKNIQGVEGLGTMFNRVVTKGKRLPLEPVEKAAGAGGGCVSKLTQIITDCWQADPAARPTFQQLIDRLDDAIVDVMFPGPTLSDARSFWNRIVGVETNSNRFSPMWKVFKEELLKFLDLTTPTQSGQTSYNMMVTTSTGRYLTLKPLKKLLLPNLDTREVAVDRFSLLIGVFGPFNQSETSFIEKINEAVAVRGFHGLLSSEEVMEKMTKREPGEYMFRISSTSRGYFTLSYFKPSKVENIRIAVTPQWKYKISDKDVQFDTFTKLAKYCQTEYNLTEPIPSDLEKSLETETNMAMNYGAYTGGKS
jgi:serine/threonine protein kinase